jgi:osmotically-inducible protein OsmY/predicted nucleic acid-binding Zn ribbon protein
MKRCPQCSSTYPDSERFCSTDGSQLVPSAAGQRATIQMPGEPGGRATVQMSPQEGPEPAVECPVCGGKALPGEELCSFCGARLNLPPAPPPTQRSQPTFTIPRQTVIPPAPHQASGTFDDEPLGSGDIAPSRSFFGFTGYVLAAIVALAAGAWFAIHLTHTGVAPAPAPSAPAAAASPAVTGPMAVLSSNTEVQVTGESASDPARSVSAATNVFNDNSSSVLDSYKKALAGDGSLSDGVLATLTVTPNGDVVAGSIKTSTTPNPALDADLINSMMGWHFTPFSGSSVEVSYPVVMARNDADKAAVESALASKVANLNSGETPEYASAPPPPAGASAAPASPAAEASPALASTEPIAPPGAGLEAPPPPEEAPATAPVAPERPRMRRHRRSAFPPPPPPENLLARVQDRLRLDRRLGRVKAYTNGGGVVTLYGKVFDDKDRRLAMNTARSVDGVNDVIDSLTTDTAEWARAEAAIAAQLQGAGLTQVSVRVIGHDAYLSGQVSTELEKEHAVTVAEGAAAVRVRTNLIRVVPKGIFSGF